jgi:anti-sigma-K factor RskA
MSTTEYHSDHAEGETPAGDKLALLGPAQKKKLLSTKIYKWDDQNMQFALGSTLESMSVASKKQSSSIKKVLWHLVKTDHLTHCGWCNLKIEKIRWSHDVFWRNVAYFLSAGASLVVMLDLHPSRVIRSKPLDDYWVGMAIQALRDEAI